MQWTLHQIILLCATDKDTLTSVNTKCCRSAFPVGVCYSSIITCLQFVLGPKSGQRRKRRKHTHTSPQQGIMGAAILHLIVAQQQAECGAAGRRVRRRTKNGPDSSRDRCHVAEDVQGHRWGPLENLGDCTSSQGPPTRTCAVNAAAERDPAPVLSRYRRPAKAQREASTWLPTQGGRRLDFHLPISTAWLPKSAQALLQNVQKKKKRIEKCAHFQNYVHFSKLPTLISAS